MKPLTPFLLSVGLFAVSHSEAAVEPLYKKAETRLAQEMPSVEYFVPSNQVDPNTRKRSLFSKLSLSYHIYQGLCQTYAGLYKSHQHTYLALMSDTADPTLLCDQKSRLVKVQQVIYGLESGDEFSINGATFKVVVKGKQASLFRVARRYRSLNRAAVRYQPRRIR